MRPLRWIAALLCAGFAAFAVAAVLTVRWDNATTNADGSAITATGAGSIARTIVTYGTCNAARDAVQTVTGTVTATGAATTAATPDLPPGVYCAFAQHENTFGSRSDPSAVAWREVLAPKPNPPRNFSFN